MLKWDVLFYRWNIWICLCLLILILWFVMVGLVGLCVKWVGLRLCCFDVWLSWRLVWIYVCLSVVCDCLSLLKKVVCFMNVWCFCLLSLRRLLWLLFLVVILFVVVCVLVCCCFFCRLLWVSLLLVLCCGICRCGWRLLLMIVLWI